MKRTVTIKTENLEATLSKQEGENIVLETLNSSTLTKLEVLDLIGASALLISNQGIQSIDISLKNLVINLCYSSESKLFHANPRCFNTDINAILDAIKFLSWAHID